MNVKALQRADRWVGVPLCLGLSVFRAWFGRALPDCSRPPRSLLFVKLAEQGSTVLAYPALKRAAEIVGRDNLYFIAFEDNRFILDALRVVPEGNVITVSADGIPRFLATMLRALRRLRALHLDAAIDLEFFSRGSAALTYLSGARRRVGFHAFFGAGPYRGNLMTHRLIYNSHLHTSQTFLSLVEAALADPAVLPTFDARPACVWDNSLGFSPSEADRTAIRNALGKGSTPAGPVILLNPNSGDLLPLRRWPSERYVELARRLVTRYPEALVAFTGAPNEAAAAEDLARRAGSERCISLAGRTTLPQLLALYTLADVLVTNDSGPAHFAALTPIHVVALFGPETPKLFGVSTPRHSTLWAGLACSPCVNAYNNRQSPCRDNLCMKAIGVDEVFAEVCRLYESRRPRPAPAATSLPAAS